MKKNWLYAVYTVMAAILLTGCFGIQNVIKSNKPELIYDTALKYYEQEKWSKAAMLLEGAITYYIGSEREDTISFYYARCKFRSRDFENAAALLDDYRRKFGRSPFIEDAEGMYALCYFYMSPGSTRDQAMTGRAIVAINYFMSRYPQSDQIDKFRSIDEDLQQRLHEKAFLNAYTYYKIEKYKSAIVALKNAQRQYPDSKYRERIMYYIVNSGYRLAKNSVLSKEADRYLSMLDSYYSFIEEFPESEYRRELDRYAAAAKDYLDKYSKNK